MIHVHCTDPPFLQCINLVCSTTADALRQISNIFGLLATLEDHADDIRDEARVMDILAGSFNRLVPKRRSPRKVKKMPAAQVET